MDEKQFNFGVTIKQLNKIMEIRFNKLLKKWDLTYSQFSVIMYLFKHQNQQIMQKNIEDAFLLKGSTVTGILKRLEEKHFITRQTDSSDRRVNYLRLLPKGLELENYVYDEVERLEKETLGVFTQNEKMILEELLRRCLDHLKILSEI
ncbi:MAG: MarR family transcriptional regulator, transcriptional regulator for hemolysin [Eubacteriaceae bacterium]|jgi:DNA-binding MarR family transcriptional regulator|nr:MarR family transcriptional regulator, transcriptional regulator for hemolysin [Eubacteriaceae bacterium]MDK2904200.1 MarR family transcriptional regulator, transcriptional regulator for hemolysin [Eubacteriaceae bacterium]MDK2937174.1 MarR family transcriptional regulator, transcriptional regulator for hemolysin [Eubacteriaceae bacterium]MDK2961530.1 MarR family transcriptional regulator, transcriptional regulator for hemolysin [Eubacteriaceae bacterium]